MNPHARDAYLASSVTTASPAQLLNMLCERLVLDIDRGLHDQEAGDVVGANNHLLHAQDIVAELAMSLRPGLWDGSAGLAAIYEHLGHQLILANIHRDTATTLHCLELAKQIRDVWYEAGTAELVS